MRSLRSSAQVSVEPRSPKKQKRSPPSATPKSPTPTQQKQTAGAATPEGNEWDRESMLKLLEAVRAESLGQPTLNPTPAHVGEDYLSKLVTRMKGLGKKSHEVHAKLEEWMKTFGEDEDEFDECERTVLKSEAQARHDRVWQSEKQSKKRQGAFAGNRRLFVELEETEAKQGSKAGDEVFSAPEAAAKNAKKRKQASQNDGQDTQGEGTEVERSQSRRKQREVDQPEPVKNLPAATCAEAATPRMDDQTEASDEEQDEMSRAGTEERRKGKGKGKAHSEMKTALAANSRANANASPPGAKNSGAASSRAGAVARGERAAVMRALRMGGDVPDAAPSVFDKARSEVRKAGGEEAYALKDPSGANVVVSVRDALESVLEGVPETPAKCQGEGGEKKSAKRRQANKNRPLLPVVTEEEEEGQLGGLQNLEGMAELVLGEAVATVRSQLSQRHVPAQLFGLEDQRAEVKELLEGCIVRGANGSALLLGPRGCGKSAVLHSVLGELRTKHKFPGFVTVWLDGALHTTDALAFRGIAKQLYLLDDMNAEIDFERELKQLCHAENNMNFLFELVKRCRVINQPMFFVLENFHLFATHPRQSLLYNLLDMTQSSRMQTVVVGTSHCLPCLELLEKRVRSRFSGRQILLSSPRTPETALQIMSAALRLPEDHHVRWCGDQGSATPQVAAAQAAPTTATECQEGDAGGLTARAQAEQLAGLRSAFRGEFNARVQRLTEDARALLALERVVQRSGDVASLETWLVAAVSRLTALDALLRPEHLRMANGDMEGDGQRDLVLGLSEPDLGVLAAMRRLEAKGKAPFTAKQVYTEHLALLKSAGAYVGGEVEGGDDGSGGGGPAYLQVMEGVERLLGSEAAVYADRGLGGVQREHRTMRLTIPQEKVATLFQQHIAGPTHLKTWAQELL